MQKALHPNRVICSRVVFQSEILPHPGNNDRSEIMPYHVITYHYNIHTIIISNTIHIPL